MDRETSAWIGFVVVIIVLLITAKLYVTYFQDNPFVAILLGVGIPVAFMAYLLFYCLKEDKK